MTSSKLTLTKMLKHFEHKRLLRIKGGAHGAKIGEWVNWWISERPRRRMVITPGPMTNWRGNSYLADILFLERSEKSDIQKVLGVAEIENSLKKATKKLSSLKAYEQNDKQYPDLRFAILCLSVYPSYYNTSNLLKKVHRHLRRLSKNSRLSWVLYLLIYERVVIDQTDYFIRMIDYVDESHYFFYNTEIKDAGWFVYKEGAIIHTSKHRPIVG